MQYANVPDERQNFGQEPGHVRNEFTCVSCGYVLRGIAVDKLCPECGTPVLNSVGRGALPNSGKAVAALVLGIVSILGCTAYGLPSLVCGPLAIYFAQAAKKDMREGAVNPSGRGMATAGFVCGLIGTILAGVGLLAFIAFFVIGLSMP